MTNHKNRALSYTRYKLVTQDYTTQGDTKWKDKGKWLTVTAIGEGNQLCSRDVIHWYDHPVLAVIANPSHAAISNPRLLVIKCSKPVNHDGLKGGSKSAKAFKEIQLPVLTTEQKVEFSIRVSFEVMTELKVDCPKWFSWAADWLSGKDRSARSARSAAESAAWSAESAARSAAESAAWSAESAARSAAWSAESAAESANAGKLFLKVLKAMKLDMKIKIQIAKF